MEQNDELQGCVFAVPSKTPWITSKPLVHKKKQHSGHVAFLIVWSLNDDGLVI